MTSMAVNPQGVNLTQRLHSNSIWWDCRTMQAGHAEGNLGFYVFDDFKAFSPLMAGSGDVTLDTQVLVASTGAYASSGGGYTLFSDGVASGLGKVVPTADINGVIRLTSDDADNAQTILKLGHNSNVQVKLREAAAVGKKLWFEARVAPVTATARNMWVGLAESGRAITDGLLDDSGAVVDKDFVAFIQRADGVAATLECLHKEEGSTLVDNGDAITTMVAATFYKLGLKYTPDGRDGEKLEWFVNGTVVQTTTAATLALSTFPSAVLLSPYFCVKNSTTASVEMDIDWFALAQEE